LTPFNHERLDVYQAAITSMLIQLAMSIERDGRERERERERER